MSFVVSLRNNKNCQCECEWSHRFGDHLTFSPMLNSVMIDQNNSSENLLILHQNYIIYYNSPTGNKISKLV